MNKGVLLQLLFSILELIILMSEEEVKRMKIAYGLLFKIENFLRHYIEQEMEKAYGPNWYHIAPRIVLKRPSAKNLNTLLFHEYERVYFRTYSLISNENEEEFYQGLHGIYPIRNKIAHCHSLCENEINQLIGFYCYLKSNLLWERQGIYF